MRVGCFARVKGTNMVGILTYQDKDFRDVRHKPNIVATGGSLTHGRNEVEEISESTFRRHMVSHYKTFYPGWSESQVEAAVRRVFNCEMQERGFRRRR